MEIIRTLDFCIDNESNSSFPNFDDACLTYSPTHDIFAFLQGGSKDEEFVTLALIKMEINTFILSPIISIHLLTDSRLLRPSLDIYSHHSNH